MGEWFSYNLCFANKESNIADALMELGVATKCKDSMGKNVIILNLEKVVNLEKTDSSENLFQSELDKNITNINIGVQNNFIYYSSKWTPDDRLVKAISQILPEDVIAIERTYTAGNAGCANWYLKEGKCTTKKGIPSAGFIDGLNPKLLREFNGCFAISLPIGETDNKWGVIHLDKDCVKYSEGPYGERYNITVIFPQEKMKILFSNGTKIVSTSEIIDSYCQAIRQYSEEMHALVKLSGLPEQNFVKKEDSRMGNIYYVVKIPCHQDISKSGYLSVTVPEYNAAPEAGEVTVGEKGKYKNVIRMSENGRKTVECMRISEIQECYERYMNHEIENTEDYDLELNY